MASQTSAMVGENLHAIRTRAGMSQAKLAAKCKYRDPETRKVRVFSRPRIAEIESGKFNPTVDTLEIIAKALGVDVSEFFLPPDGTGQGRLAS